MNNLYAIVKINNCSDRPEIVCASTSRSRIDAKLEDIKIKQVKEDIFEYVEGDYLELKNDEVYYIEKINKII